MQATRYRLRWLPGLGLETALTYGDGAYGSGSFGFASEGMLEYGTGEYGAGAYGEESFTLVTALNYEVVPWTAGWPTAPSWIYRVGDTWPPLQLRVYGDGIPLNLNTMDAATFVLTPMDGRPSSIQLDTWGDGQYGAGNYGEAIDFPLEIYLAAALVPGVAGLLTHVWQLPPPVINVPGVYRLLVFIQFPGESRYLTIACDDRLTFVVIDDERQVA